MRARVGCMRAWPDESGNSNNEKSGAAVAPPPRAEREQPSQGGAETAAVAAGGLAASEQQMTKLAGSEADAEADPYAELDYDLADKDAPEKASQATELWSGSEISVSDAAVAAIGKNKEAQGAVSLSDTSGPSDSEERRKETSIETRRPEQKRRRSSDSSSSRRKRQKCDQKERRKSKSTGRRGTSIKRRRDTDDESGGPRKKRAVMQARRNCSRGRDNGRGRGRYEDRGRDKHRSSRGRDDLSKGAPRPWRQDARTQESRGLRIHSPHCVVDQPEPKCERQSSAAVATPSMVAGTRMRRPVRLTPNADTRATRTAPAAGACSWSTSTKTFRRKRAPAAATDGPVTVVENSVADAPPVAAVGERSNSEPASYHCALGDRLA